MLLSSLLPFLFAVYEKSKLFLLKYKVAFLFNKISLGNLAHFCRSDGFCEAPVIRLQSTELNIELNTEWSCSHSSRLG